MNVATILESVHAIPVYSVIVLIVWYILFVTVISESFLKMKLKKPCDNTSQTGKHWRDVKLVSSHIDLSGKRNDKVKYKGYNNIINNNST